MVSLDVIGVINGHLVMGAEGHFEKAVFSLYFVVYPGSLWADIHGMIDQQGHPVLRQKLCQL
jgi:hypothetical protein